MIEGIVAFFTALPQLIGLISRMGTIFDSLIKYANQNNMNAWLDNLEKSIDSLKSAQTTEEKLDAAQGLVNIVRGLGPK